MRGFLAFFFVLGMNGQAGSQPPPTLPAGAYLGQTPPGDSARLFAPGWISTAEYEHSAPAFSPDGHTVIWGLVSRDRPAWLLEMHMEQGFWTAPVPPSFHSSDKDDMYPRFSPDGKKLFFMSRRPLPPGYPPLIDSWIWVVERSGNGWGTPYPLDSLVCEGVEYAHSVSEKGTVMFSFRKENGRIFDIAEATQHDGRFERAHVLPETINSNRTEDGPFISPDESFFLFESSREGGFGSNDLYICFKNASGKWGVPVNLGPRVNTSFSERFAALSPDGKYLFFGSDRNGNADIYWIRADFLQELRSGQDP